MGINSLPGRGIERLTDKQREIRELRKQLLTSEKMRMQVFNISNVGVIGVAVMRSRVI